MSITIPIPKGHPREKTPALEDSLEEPADTIVNLPKHQQAKPNDLSKFEQSICSSKSKYTLSGDDMNSNLSFDSGCMSYRRTVTLPAGNDLEKEIDFEHTANYSTPKKNSSYVRNYYYNENNTNFSSERVICNELSSARKKMSAENNNMSNFSNIINDKSDRHINTNTIITKPEDNFVFNVIRNFDKETKEANRKPKQLNNGFIQEEKLKKKSPVQNYKDEKDNRIEKINEKVNSMKKSHDTMSKNSDSGYSSNSTSVKLTCFQKCSSNNKI